MSTAESVIDQKIQKLERQSEKESLEHGPYYMEDEISLIDLWLVLIKRRNILIAVWGFIALVALIAALAMPKQYTFSTSIEIGSRIINENIRPIEEPQTLLAKVQESYIPLAQHEFNLTHPDNTNVFKITARIPKGSEIVVLESKGTQTDSEILKTLQQSVVDKVKQDHQRIIGTLRQEVEIERNVAKSKLEELKDEVKLVNAKQKRLNDMSQLLKNQIEDTKKYIANVTDSRLKAANEVNNEATAMTLLMLDTDIQQQRERLAQLEERLFIKVAEEQDNIEKKLADNKRAQANQQDQISTLETQLINLRETRPLVPPMQSNEPTGLSKKIVVLLGLIVGVIVAIFIAFFAEFLSKAQEQITMNRAESQN
jgi:hypothetical protein